MTGHCNISSVMKEINEIIKMPGIETNIKIEMISKKVNEEVSDKEIKALFIDTKKLFKECKLGL